jgi:hypothetical protein
VITSVPYTTTQGVSTATRADSDPAGCTSTASVWFSYTPATDGIIIADTFGSSYDTVLSGWTGTEGSLTMLACRDDSAGTWQSQVSVAATAGTTYYFMVAVCCGYDLSGGATLKFSLSLTPPTANDDFAAATPVNAVPYSDIQDLGGTGTEEGEPTTCFTADNSIWYSYTATADQCLMATANEYYVGIAVYSGDSLANLTQVGCSIQAYYRPATFRALAGQTYYFQAAGVYGTGTFRFGLDVAPQPESTFIYSGCGWGCTDLSTYDNVLFQDQSYDPLFIGFASWLWEFGDGTTSTEQRPWHQYATDGDYEVRLTMTTVDGRVSTASDVLHVSTHDVAITRLTLPGGARVGQTIDVSVYVKSYRYPEQVRVDLFRSTPDGYRQVGSSTGEVTVTKSGPGTRFSFAYTVTSQDAASGRMTFKATATILDHRDAVPTNNDLISVPVTVP